MTLHKLFDFNKEIPMAVSPRKIQEMPYWILIHYYRITRYHVDGQASNSRQIWSDRTMLSNFGKYVFFDNIEVSHGFDNELRERIPDNGVKIAIIIAELLYDYGLVIVLQQRRIFSQERNERVFLCVKKR